MGEGGEQRRQTTGELCLEGTPDLRRGHSSIIFHGSGANHALALRVCSVLCAVSQINKNRKYESTIISTHIIIFRRSICREPLSSTEAGRTA